MTPTERRLDGETDAQVWREIADEQAHALRKAVASMEGSGVRHGCLCEWDENGTPIGDHGPLCFTSLHSSTVTLARAALRRYEEANAA